MENKNILVPVLLVILICMGGYLIVNQHHASSTNSATSATPTTPVTTPTSTTSSTSPTTNSQKQTPSTNQNQSITNPAPTTQTAQTPLVENYEEELSFISQLETVQGEFQSGCVANFTAIENAFTAGDSTTASMYGGLAKTGCDEAQNDAKNLSTSFTNMPPDYSDYVNATNDMRQAIDYEIQTITDELTLNHSPSSLPTMTADINNEYESAKKVVTDLYNIKVYLYEAAGIKS